MNLVVAKDYRELSQKTAQTIAHYINANPDSVLCLAAGDTPLGTFQELIRMQQRGEVDLSSVFYAGLDEWVGLGYETKGSCRQVMFDTFYTPACIDPARIHVFDGLNENQQRECDEMEHWIASHGGLLLSLLGVGMNGHVGFNEPHVPDRNGCVVADLDEVTKEVCVKYFGVKLAVTKGVTLGLSLLKSSKKLIVLANGSKKASIMRRAFCEMAAAELPVSLLQGHSDLSVMLDEEAAAEILA